MTAAALVELKINRTKSAVIHITAFCCDGKHYVRLFNATIKKQVGVHFGSGYLQLAPGEDFTMALDDAKRFLGILE